MKVFEPNCVILLIAPEISLKSEAVRNFMVNKLKKNVLLYLNHNKIVFDSITFFSGRMIIKTNQVSEAIKALRTCFGVISLFPTQVINFASLSELKTVSSDLFSGYSNESFAVRGKSFSKSFSSKKLEEELGGVVLKKFPEMKVKLKNPEKEFFCVTKKNTAFFYFNEVSGAGGMPVSVQGKVGVIITKNTTEKDLIYLGMNLLRIGAALTIVTNSSHDFDLSKLEEYGGFIKLRTISVTQAIEEAREGRIKAFFSCARKEDEARKDYELVKEKVLAPLLT